MKKAATFALVVGVIAFGVHSCFGSADLVSAILDGNTEKVANMLEDGANPNRSFAGMSPLYWAVDENQIQMVALLLDAGADIDRTNGVANRSALHEAVLDGRLDIVKLLVERGADINNRNTHDRTPLYYALYSTGDNVKPEVAGNVDLAPSLSATIVAYLKENGATE